MCCVGVKGKRFGKTAGEVKCVVVEVFVWSWLWVCCGDTGGGDCWEKGKSRLCLRLVCGEVCAGS